MSLLQLGANLSRQDIEKLHSDYLNSGLVQLMGLLDFNKGFVRAKGVSVWDEQGIEYLDFLGGYGTLNLGHNPPEIFEAIKWVFGTPNILQASLGKYPAILAHNLSMVTPSKLKRTFFSNSGAEAIETAIKLARAATGRKVILSLQNSFHGKTMGALSLTGKRSYQEPFDPMLPGCEILVFGDFEQLRGRLLKKDVAAFIVEPIQGEGGVRSHPQEYLRAAQEICNDTHTLFVLDEIQTGFGRTGKLFAAEHDQLNPDIMCLAKSLSGGIIPIGATITSEDVWQKAMGGLSKCLRHTSTFGGNAYACVAGIAALDSIIGQGLAHAAAEKGTYLLRKLRDLKDRFSFIKDVRGRGLLIGIEFDAGGLVGRAAYQFLGSMIAGKLLNDHRIITAYTLNNPTVVRIEPPLTVSYGQINVLLDSLEQVLEQNSSAMKLVLSSGFSAIQSKI